jgi:hypothetical protein
VAAAVAAFTFAVALLLQAAVLPRSPRGTSAALHAETWFEHHRLVESSIRVDDRVTHGRCARTWFQRRGRRPAPGTLLRLADGFTLLVVPLHRIETASGTSNDRTISLLVDLELAGCSQLLGRFLRADAENRQVIGLVRKTIGGSLLLALTIPIDATQLTLYLEPRNYRPVSLAVIARGLRGTSQIHFAPLTTPALRSIEQNIPRG